MVERARRWPRTTLVLAAVASMLTALAATAPRSAASPGDVRLVDRFDRPDAPSLGSAESGQGWSVWSGSWGVSAGRAAPSSGGYSLAVVDSGGSTGVVSVVVAEPSPEFWLVLRASDGANYWRFGRWQSGAYELQQIVNNGLGGPAVSVLASVQPAAGDVVSCELRSPGLGCSVNGVPVVATADGFNGSASSVGLAVWDPAGELSTRFDDLSVRDLAVVADLSVGLADVDPVMAGGSLRWTATVSNVGAAPAVDTSVQVTVPAGLSGVSVSSSAGSCSGLVCELGDVDAAASVSVVVEAVAPSVPGPVTVTVAASSPGVVNSADDARSETTTVQAAPPPGVRVLDRFDRPDAPSLGSAPTGERWTMHHGSASVVAGRAASGAGYTLAVLDGGDGDGLVTLRVAQLAPEFWMVLRASDGANYWRFGRWQSGAYQLQQIVGNGLGAPTVTTAAAVTPAADDLIECRALGGGLRCSVNGTVVASVASGADPAARGVGFATWDPAGTGEARFDDLAVADIPAVPDVSVALDDDDPVVVGGALRWTATVVNGGTSPATDTSLTVELPDEVTAVTVNASQGWCAAGELVTCSLGELPVGEAASVELAAPAPEQPGTLTAIASVHAAEDGNAGNDIDVEATWVRTPPAVGGRLVDGFDRTAATLGSASTGEPWTVHSGEFVTGDGYAHASSGQLSVAAVDPGWSYGTYEVTVGDVGDGRFWAAFRIVDGFNYFRVGPDPSTGRYRLDRVVDGVALPVAISIPRADITAADGDRIRIVNRPDDGIFVSINGVHLIDAGDPASLDVGRFGFAVASTGPTIDHVEIGQVMTTGVLSSDAFDRPDSTTLGAMSVGTHYAWFPQSWPGWGVTDGRAHQLGDSYGSVYVDTSAEAGDVRVVVPTVGDEFAVAFRYDEMEGRYYRFGRLGPGEPYGVDLVHGWFAEAPPVPVEQLAAVYPADGDVLEVRQRLDGTVECLVNGVAVFRFTDTVTMVRSTIYGLASGGNRARFDDFSVVPE